MAYMYQTPVWALPNHQFRYPELFQQQQQQQQRYELEQESNRAAWEAYMTAFIKHIYGDDYTQYRQRQLAHEAAVMDHLNELAWQNQIIRRELEKLNTVVSLLTAAAAAANADADCDCDCHTDPDVLAECDAPGWLHHSDGEEEEEDSLERFQCGSCGSDHPHFAAAFVVPPPTADEEEKDGPTEGEGKGKGKEVEQEQRQEEFADPWAFGVEQNVASMNESERSSRLGSSA